MATSRTPARRHGHPGRTLIVLAIVTAGLFGLMAAFHTWTPKLGLDLRGGTTITLTGMAPYAIYVAHYHKMGTAAP